MSEFKNYPIRHKLMTMSLLACGVALLLATTAFMTYDFFSYRSSLVIRLLSLGEIISANVASAVVFNDNASAAHTLLALKGRHSMIAGAIFTTDGKVFAGWHRDSDAVLA